MKIGIVGAATVGATLAAKFEAGDYVVFIANNGSPQRSTKHLADEGSTAKPASVAEALASDVVFLSGPG